MKIEKVPIDSISSDPANARKHGKKNLDAIKGSLRRFGQQKPIVVDASNIVRAGNGTLVAAKELGWTEIAIVRSPLQSTEMTAFAIADNRTGELAEWDDEALNQQLASLDAAGFDMKELGFDDLPDPTEELNAGSQEIESKFEVVVECMDESSQRQLFERLRNEGHKCRLLSL